MLVDAYLRVSKTRGRTGPSFISPVQQREKIETYCTLHGYRIGEEHEELDQSGARRDRPKLMRAVERIEAGQSGGLVVAKLDRFGRTLVHGLATIERIQQAGGIFASVMDQFDTASPHGRFVLKVMLSLAELELDRIRDNFDDARRRAIARGIHPCPVPPAGYQRRSDGGLEPDPHWGSVVRQLIECAADGDAWAELARWAEGQGLPTAYGNQHWTGRAVKLLVRNPVYLGVAHHGEFQNADAHEPLVDEATWRRARRPGRTATARSTRPALLAGLLRCGSCRYTMRSYVVRGYRQYTCHRAHARGRCSNPVAVSTRAGIEELVIQRFFDAVGEIQAVGAAKDATRLPELQRQAADAEQALAAYRDDSEIIVTLGMERYRAGLRALTAAADAAHAAFAEEQDRQGPLAGAVVGLNEAWPDLQIEERRKLLGLAFDAVFLLPGAGALNTRVHACLRGSAPLDMPRRGRKGAGELRPFEAASVG
jgi:site-specific DNA recombinase